MLPGLVFRSSFLYLVFGAQTRSRRPSQHSRHAPFRLPECTTSIAGTIVRAFWAVPRVRIHSSPPASRYLPLLGRVSVVSLKRRGRCSCVKASFDHSTFSRNRARLLEHETAGEFFRAVVAQARTLKLLSDEHFTVDGTLVEAWASLKSFKRKDAGPNEPRAMRGFRT